MCGIAGYIALEARKYADCDDHMAEAIRYRGLDAEARWTDHERVTLFHSRLSIIDLEGGHQPMQDSSGRYTIVYNGEVYNYLELREEYKDLGSRFRTDSDTEVIIEGFRHKGENVLDDLNGMFAFAIWDAWERRLFLARDQLGKKPLYWCRIGDGFFFASTSDAFSAVPGWHGELSPSSMILFHFLGNFPEDRTAYSQVRALPHACFARVKPGDLQPSITRYWRASYGSKTSASLDRHIEDYEAILTDAIAIRLRSDVPLAITFSGGCDSGTIAAIAKKKLGADLHCYTLDYHTVDEPSEEVTRAERVAKILELDWSFINYDYRNIILNDLQSALSYFDQPCSQFALSYSYALYRKMKDNYTVLLSGAGADEIFAGYAGMEMVRRQDVWRRGLRYLPKRWRCLLNTKLRSWITNTTLDGEKVSKWAQRDLMNYVRNYSSASEILEDCQETIDRIADELDACGVDTMLDFAMYKDLTVSAVDANFRLPDITGYLAQVEVRSPFLDRRMVEFAARMSPQYKIARPFGDSVVKYMPKSYYSRHVPDEIAYARKYGMGGNLLWNYEFTRGGVFYQDFEIAIDMLSQLPFKLDPVNFAAEQYIKDQSEKILHSPYAGPAMSAFMLGKWIEQRRAVAA